jgi:hypothetical protein
MDRYTTVQANAINKEGYQFNWLDVLQKPAREFLSRYFFGNGYKDGLHGLVIALLQAFSELVLYAKLWQKNKFIQIEIKPVELTEEITRLQREVNHWKADMLLSQSKGLFQNIIQRIKRKFKLL